MESQVLEKTIKNIDRLYSDLLGANNLIPDSANIEQNKLSLDNLRVIMEKAIQTVREIKSDLDEHKNFTPGTWNPPA